MCAKKHTILIGRPLQWAMHTRTLILGSAQCRMEVAQLRPTFIEFIKFKTDFTFLTPFHATMFSTTGYVTSNRTTKGH